MCTLAEKVGGLAPIYYDISAKYRAWLEEEKEREEEKKKEEDERIKRENECESSTEDDSMASSSPEEIIELVLAEADPDESRESSPIARSIIEQVLAEAELAENADCSPYAVIEHVCETSERLDGRATSPAAWDAGSDAESIKSREASPDILSETEEFPSNFRGNLERHEIKSESGELRQIFPPVYHDLESRESPFNEGAKSTSRESSPWVVVDRAESVDFRESSVTSGTTSPKKGSTREYSESSKFSLNITCVTANSAESVKSRDSTESRESSLTVIREAEEESKSCESSRASCESSPAPNYTEFTKSLESKLKSRESSPPVGCTTVELNKSRESTQSRDFSPAADLTELEESRDSFRSCDSAKSCDSSLLIDCATVDLAESEESRDCFKSRESSPMCATMHRTESTESGYCSSAAPWVIVDSADTFDSHEFSPVRSRPVVEDRCKFFRRKNAPTPQDIIDQLLAEAEATQESRDSSPAARAIIDRVLAEANLGDDCQFSSLSSTRYRPETEVISSNIVIKKESAHLNSQVCRSPIFRRKFLNQRNQKHIKAKQSNVPFRTGASGAKEAEGAEESGDGDGAHDLISPASGDLEAIANEIVSPTANGVASPGSESEENGQSGGLATNFSDMLHPPEIEGRYDAGRMIGDGNFAIVFEALDRVTNLPVALKVIDKSKCTGKEEMVESEVSLLRRIRHAHIVELIDTFDSPKRYYLAMELIPGGDLFDALVSVRQYMEVEAAQLMHNLMAALDYLHNNNIVHRDVKPENLLVYEEGGRKRLKLADFGLAAEVDDYLYTVCGTPTYVAPEILAENGYGLKVDVWAGGVIMYIMLCGFPPFVSMANCQEELFDMILAGQYTFPSPYWDHVSRAAKSLIQGMLQLDVNDRYSSAEVLIHPWITGEAKCDGGYEEPLSEWDSSSSDIQLYRKSHGSEFFYSRRRSMDELSQATTVHQDQDQDSGSELGTSFVGEICWISPDQWDKNRKSREGKEGYEP